MTPCELVGVYEEFWVFSVFHIRKVAASYFFKRFHQYLQTNDRFLSHAFQLAIH